MSPSTHRRPVGLLFPGQGSQHIRMAAGLYRSDPTFTFTMDRVLALMGEEGPAIRADWLSEDPLISIDDVRRAQPLLFAVDYALGRMILSWGIRPTALLGHSAGELVAATLAGVVRLSDAVLMMRERVRAAVAVPAGGMLAVAAGEDRVRPHLTGDVVIAAVNANAQVMLAGTTGPLEVTAGALRSAGLTVVRVPATSPFHSPAMEPAAEAIQPAYEQVRLRPPTVPLYSGYTGGPMRDEDACSARFWARQVTDPVYFAPALDNLLAAEDMLLIEAGPRQTLTAFARRHPAVRLRASAAVPLLPARPGSPEGDRRSVLAAAEELREQGYPVNPGAMSGNRQEEPVRAVAGALG
ncbi:acyltransferase domain-containing protein [Streptomyces sp. ACA25]|uniref:acyltransferase domain-containing protein n=1 Tax=Streptomyces sp. ACA25 TaxID=3022596 RepID=UPI002307FD76|nr:acyltransferase domain-containing protein [Streptomyces sp. ACA25]MDB1089580.1 acyltransferase domain-containing protein [Streptomyces sp. ACA25]